MLATYISMVWLAQVMAANEQKSAIKVVDFLTGGDSNVAHQDAALVDSRYDWAQVWEKNQFYQVLGAAQGAPVDPDKVPDLPVIDFDRTRVIAIWGGNASNISGYNLVGNTLENKADVIWLSPQVMAGGAAMKAMTRPYAFIQVTRGKNEIDVMLQVGVNGEGQPIWKRVANFPKRG